ncbi:hypothetical protein KIN20_000729 [Parelaphostrongylus tenuis]|uniref:Uncharacterized protein n=1 Tax=Parelaphostrongylus tenuis TaxID=148309 RepID=A0AAD5LWM4_PARTN|nr:hypothetical protein KIN20_000729 [Parelaphostrongylus tenuis]
MARADIMGLVTSLVWFLGALFYLWGLFVTSKALTYITTHYRGYDDVDPDRVQFIEQMLRDMIDEIKQKELDIAAGAIIPSSEPTLEQDVVKAKDASGPPLSDPKSSVDETPMHRHSVCLLILSLALHVFATPYKVEDLITFSSNKHQENSVESSTADRSTGGNHSNSGSPWPDGDYCIMPGPSLKCPYGFRMDFISLAVPVNFGTRESYREKGKELPYIELGSFGGMNLELREYDQAYILRLNACCK